MGEMTSPTGDKVPGRLVVTEYANMDAAHQVVEGWWANRTSRRSASTPRSTFTLLKA